MAKKRVRKKPDEKDEKKKEVEVQGTGTTILTIKDVLVEKRKHKERD